MGQTNAADFRETDIRPDELMARSRELLEEDTRRLMRDEAQFVIVPCPACGAHSHAPLWHKRGMTFVRCTECHTGYGNPRPTPERLARYYAEATYYEYWNRYIYPRSEKARRERIFRPRVQQVLELCRRHGVPMRTLVEVGAGSGMFCQEMLDTAAFQRVVAIEPTPASAAACRVRALEVIARPVEQVELDALQVSVIAAFEVLEHLFDPLAFVRACACQLPCDSLLVFTCPNGQGFDVATLGATADTVTPEHLNYFNPDSLRRLLERGGLRTLEVLTPGRLDAEIVRKKVLAGEHSLEGQPFLQRVLIDEWERLGAAFQDFLSAHGLSSHQWIVARPGSDTEDVP